MNFYNTVLFLHILGAMGMFAVVGLEWTALRPLRRATTSEGVQTWLRVLRPASRLGPASMLTLLLTGFYMTAALRTRMAWVMVSMVGLIVLGILAGGLTGRRIKAIRRGLSASEPGALSPELQRLVRHPALWISLQLRTGLFLGIVFVMTTKPAMLGSLLTLAVTTAVALAIGPVLWRSEIPEARAAADVTA